MQIEIWSDVVCPWCYLGTVRVERALAAFEHRDDVEIVYRSFELDPGTPVGSTEPTVDVLARKYGMTPEQARDAQQQMEQRAAGDVLQFRMGELRSGNTRDAHRLLHLARTHGVQAALNERLHRAYFVEQGSIFDAASLADLAAEAGLPRAEAVDVLAGDLYTDAVLADEQTARELGVTGVPFVVLDRRFALSGAQPADTVLRALEQAYAA